MNMQEKINELNAVRAQVLVNSIKDDVSRLDLGVEVASPMVKNGKPHGTLGYGGAKRAFEAFVAGRDGTFKVADVSAAAGIASPSVWTRLVDATASGKVVRVGKGLFARAGQVQP